MWNKLLTVIVAVAILGGLATLGYIVTMPKAGEKITEFYITGPEGRVEKYPVEFTLDDSGKVATVNYVSFKFARIYEGPIGEEEEVTESAGKVTLVVVNRERQETKYTAKMTIGGKPNQIETNEDGELKRYDELTFSLNDGERQEYKISFAPQEIYGSTRLTSPALKGQKELEVESTSNLEAGDYILVGTAGSDELVQIAATNGAQATIILETGLLISDQPVERTVVEQKKVEFALYKSGGDEPYATLHLWIHVKEQR